MSERDELAGTIEGALDSSHGIIAWTGAAQEDIADAILAAGYRKPRTITTAEELRDATPGIVIRENKHGIIWEKLSDGEGGTLWVETGDAEDYKHTAVELPATVLHEPTP